MYIGAFFRVRLGKKPMLLCRILFVVVPVYLSLIAFLWKSFNDMAFLRMLIDWKMPLLPVTTWQIGSGILSGIVSTSIGSFRGTHSFGGMIWNGNNFENRNLDYHSTRTVAPVKSHSNLQGDPSGCLHFQFDVNKSNQPDGSPWRFEWDFTRFCSHLRKASLMGADALDEFHVLVKVFEFIPCRPEHHDGGDVRVGARVTPIRVVVRAHHLRHGDGEGFSHPIET